MLRALELESERGHSDRSFPSSISNQAFCLTYMILRGTLTLTLLLIRNLQILKTQRTEVNMASYYCVLTIYSYITKWCRVTWEICSWCSVSAEGNLRWPLAVLTSESWVSLQREISARRRLVATKLNFVTVGKYCTVNQLKQNWEKWEINRPDGFIKTPISRQIVYSVGKWSWVETTENLCIPKRMPEKIYWPYTNWK